MAGAAAEYAAKMRSPGPVLSKAGDLGDFPARYKMLKFIGKIFQATLRVAYLNGGGWGTLNGKF